MSRERGTCTIGDCGRPHFGRGWCTMHYQRWRIHGDPLVVARSGPRVGERRKERSARWKGDNVGYHAVHMRLRAERGPASLHPCAMCGETAHDWAFDQPTGYSTDPSRYRPLCQPCHRATERQAA